jgi:hypothetical protein
LSVDHDLREFLVGRQSFATLMENLREADGSGAEGRAAIDRGLTGLVNAGAFPGDLAATIRAALDAKRPREVEVDDLLDLPTVPRRAAADQDAIAPRQEAQPAVPSEAAQPSARDASTSPVAETASAPQAPDPLRDKFDSVVLSALVQDFRGFRRQSKDPETGAGKASDRQLDAALASFKAARLRHDATKASEGSARPFDFTQLATSEAERPLRVGTILKNRFVLDREIGRGGMGIVYRAVDRRRLEAMHQQPYVAVKLLTGDFRRSPDALRALEAEARRAQELAHPHIVTIYDFDRDGAHVFIVMELLRGRPLDAVLRDKTRGLGYEESAALIAGICRGLAYAHARGVIHCDLKPANIFLQEAGGVKLLDFGIATAGWAGGFDLSSLNGYTVAYASPEVLEGAQRDPRDDIYALGCLVYAALTGRHPFDRISALEARERSLRPARPAHIPSHSWRALRRALSFERGKRAKDAEAFRKDYFDGGRSAWWRSLLGLAR